jgi:hypothetical protein
LDLAVFDVINAMRAAFHDFIHNIHADGVTRQVSGGSSGRFDGET